MPAEPICEICACLLRKLRRCAAAVRAVVQMTLQDKEALMRQIMEAGFAMDDVVLFLDTHPENQGWIAITRLSATCEIRPLPPMKASSGSHRDMPM
ncbi:MAG: spore coat protein CotJB [Lachnospiraceae bacterium]